MKKTTVIEKILLVLLFLGIFITFLRWNFQNVDIKPNVLFVLMQLFVLMVLGRFKIGWSAIPSMMVLAPTMSVLFIFEKYLIGVLIFFLLTVYIKAGKKITEKKWFEIAIVQTIIQVAMSPIMYMVYYEEVIFTDLYMDYFNMYGGSLSLITLFFAYYLTKEKYHKEDERKSKQKGVFLQKK